MTFRIAFGTILVSGLVLAGVPGFVSAASSEFDGTYSGEMKLMPGGSPRCPPGRTVTLTVKDGKVPVSWRKEPGEAVIKLDGSFAGAVGGAKASGKITGDKLEKEIGDANCTYQWSLKRDP